MIIDAHCHVYPDKIAAKASASTGGFYDMPMHADGSISVLLREGEKAGIDKFIIQSVATTPAQVRSINRFIADTVKAYPDKMVGLGTLHRDSTDIAGDIEHLCELGLRGVKLHPDIQKIALDDPGCMKIYEICEEKGIPFLIHTGDKRYDYSNPNRLIPILKAFPALTVTGAHFGGWSIWEEATEKLHGINNLYVDCSSSFCALDDETAVRLIHTYGADRVLFGSDYPMWEPAAEVGRLLSLPLTQEEKELITHKNAEKIYGL